jgi:ankyrin repeat protein
MNQILRNGGMTLLLVVPLMVMANSDMRLIDAAREGDLEAVKSLIKAEVNVNVKKGDGSTALHYAVHRNNLDLVSSLIKAGAEPGAANEYGVTPLSLACTNRNIDIVKLLLETGTDPNAATWTGQSVLMDCIRTGTTEAVAA